MASSKEFMEFVAEQMSLIEEIRYRKMFGEYGIYAFDKFFGMVCDNKLFIKITNAGRNYLENPVEDAPYPGAKLHFLIEEKIDDPTWLKELILRTVEELPAPKPKKKKKKEE
ncbi:MAG: TfoX/Sxy family protein [Bacteroidota bacterium]